MSASSAWDVLVVGAGPSGLAAATRLRQLGVDRVLVIDREKEPGGIPRHCFHTGFGRLDLKRFVSGPKYAQTHVRRTIGAGVEIRTECTAVGWRNGPDGIGIEVTGPTGVQEIDARSILLATGCRERPRSARFVPGARPDGVYTTGALQQCVYLRHQPPGAVAVVIGAEHVSYSAVMTLREAGASVAAMVTAFPRTQTYAPAHWWIARRHGIPLHVDCTVTRILGRDRVAGVEIESAGNRQTIACDCVVFTGDWIPDYEFCRAGGIALDAGTRGPDVDQSLRTPVRGVFASGNLLRGAEMADVAALEGRHAAQSIARFLSRDRSSPSGEAWGEADQIIPIHAEDPILWTCPNRVAHDGTPPPRGRFTFRVSRFQGSGRVAVRQGALTLAARTFRRLIPNRWYTLKAGPWVDQVKVNETLTVRFEDEGEGSEGEGSALENGVYRSRADRPTIHD